MLSHASRSSRHVFLISAAVAFLAGGLGRTAAAKDCATNSDCSAGYQCVPQGAYAATGGATSVGSAGATGSLDNGAGGAGGAVASPGGAVGYSCPGGGNCSPPIQVPTPVTGTCAIVCATVADCPSVDFDCVMNSTVTNDPTCAPNTTCETPPPPTATSGTCVAKLHACSTAADCLAPLTCQAQEAACSSSGGVGPDGTPVVSTPVCEPGPSVCSWDPVTCTTDTGCADPLYQCVNVGGSGCSSSSGATCATGENCPAPDPQPCTTTAVMNCLPRLVDCACGPCPAGAVCGACATCLPGWSCFDFSIVGGIPSSWGSIASNQACLPDGIIMAAQGHAAVNGQFGVSSTSGSGGTPALDVGGTGGTSGNNGTGTGPGQSNSTNPSPVNPVPPNESAGGAVGSVQPMAHSSGCAYGGSDASSVSLWLALAMTGLVARLARRRRG